MAPSLRLGLSGCHSQLGECACLSISSERIRLQDRFFLCIDCVKAAAYFIREIITFTVELLLKAFAEFLHKDHGSRLFLGRAEELTTGYQGTLLEPSHCYFPVAAADSSPISSSNKGCSGLVTVFFLDEEV